MNAKSVNWGNKNKLGILAHRTQLQPLVLLVPGLLPGNPRNSRLQPAESIAAISRSGGQSLRAVRSQSRAWERAFFVWHPWQSLSSVRVFSRLCATLICVCLFASIVCSSESSSEKSVATDEATKTLTSFAAVLDAFKTQQQVRADLEGVVVYVNTLGSFLRVQDDQARILTCTLEPFQQEAVRALQLGDRIELRSVVVPQKRAVQIEEFEVIGHSDPVVKPLLWQKNEPFASYGRYVETKGIVQEICLKGNLVNFLLKVEERSVMVRLHCKEFDSKFESWLGKQVQVQGPMAKNFVFENCHFGYRIDLMDESQIELLETTTPGGLLQEQIAKGKGVKAFHGTIDGADPSQCVFVNGARIPTQFAFLGESGRMSKGYVIRNENDGKEDSFVFMQLAEFNKPPSPVPVDASKFLSNVPMQTRGSVEGIVVGWHRNSFWSECYAESDGTRFRAMVPTYQNKTLEADTDKFSLGSRVQFTGVVTKPNKSRFPDEAFVLRVESIHDMTLVKTAAEMARELLGRWLMFLGGMLAVVMIWSFSLQRQVAIRTKTIVRMSSLMQSASEAIPDGMLIFSNDQRLVTCNERAKNYVGEIAKGKVFQSDISRALKINLGDSDEFLAFWNATFQNPQVIAEREFKTCDGLGFRSFYTAPIPDTQGGFTGRIWKISDTTMLRQTESERVHAQKLQAIGRLAGGIAHDFNNLLTAISANLSLAVSPHIHEESRKEHVAISQCVVQRASKLTKQLLGFSRQSTLEVTVVDVSALVAELHELMQHTLDSTIDFNVKTQNDLFPCRADVMQLEQVLVNLCLNARDALVNKYGSIWIHASNTIHPDLGDCVLISVEDNGIGMSQETQERIFEPFFTTKDIGSGTGLGLSLAIGVIEQLGGKIECHSKLGKGTRFDVLLPRCENAVQFPSNQGSSVTSTLTDVQPLNILLVDDDATLRDCGSLLLTTLGHHVQCAENGVEALKILASDASIHTVLLDLTMPIMSGTEALAIIRTDFPKVRVVICSGYSVEAATLTSNIQLQPDGILAKPYQVSDLQRVLTPSVST